MALPSLPRALASAALSLVLALLAAAPPAAAKSYAPPAGKVLQGVASGDSTADFRARTGRPPAVWQQWVRWGGAFEYAFERAETEGTRLMLHVSTAGGQHQPGVISPGAIADGDGDAWLLRLRRRLAEHGSPVYVRVMGEMNNCDNAYASHDCNGRPRGASHAPAQFKRAWRRIAVVLRGGSAADVDRRLRALRLAPVRAGGVEAPRPEVALVWSPMTGGSPMISALRPQVFWPGARHVDWVGTSFYSRFPNFHFLEPFYQRFAARHRKPFAFGEWAMWGSDSGAFARRLFAWVAGHRRVRMMVYNQGDSSTGPFRLGRFPRARSVIRRALSARRFDAPPAGSGF